MYKLVGDLVRVAFSSSCEAVSCSNMYGRIISVLQLAQWTSLKSEDHRLGQLGLNTAAGEGQSGECRLGGAKVAHSLIHTTYSRCGRGVITLSHCFKATKV